MDSLKYLFRIGHLIIIIAVVGIAGILMLSILPTRGNVKILSVLSGSMTPEIGVGSAVIVKPAKIYLTNEVITFAPNGNEKQLITHRIVAKQLNKEGKKVYLTKGDANEEADSWLVQEENIKGKVILNIPYLGYLSEWVKKPAGFVALIVLPAAILIYGELMAMKIEIVRYWKKKRLKKHGSVLKILLLILLVWGIPFGVTKAVLTDRSVSTENTLGISTDYGNPTPTAEPTPEMPNVILNEIMPNGEINPSEPDEWIELYNRDSEEHDLSGWKIKDEAGNFFVFPEGTVITGNGFLVFTKEETKIPLNNGGDIVILLATPNDVEIDNYTYTANPGEGVSLGREIDGGLLWKVCDLSSQGTSNNGVCTVIL